jgi:hypothetical protein
VDRIVQLRSLDTTLLADGRADFNYSTSGPLFHCQKKRVTLIINPDDKLSVSSTVYGHKGFNQSVYSPWTTETGLLRVSGTPFPTPSICLGMQIKLSDCLADTEDSSITCYTQLDIGQTNLVA